MRDSVFNSMVQLEISGASFEMEVLLSDPQSVSLSETYLAEIKVCFVLTFQLEAILITLYILGLATWINLKN